MMRISLLNAGKRYNREWIFRHFNYQFLPGQHYAITGPNGSGKSTLLQVAGGAAMTSEGSVFYEDTDTGYRIPDKENTDTGYRIPDRSNNLNETETNEEPKTVSFKKPHLESAIRNPAPSAHHPVSGIRYQTITEPYKYLSFAAPYLELIEEMTAMEFLTFHSRFKPFVTNHKDILSEVGISNAANKQIRYFSSGMKQRLKLAQAFFSDTPVLLLDEPATNLDAEGMKLYHILIEKYAFGKLVIVSSNDEEEYDFCKEVIRIGDYK